MRVICVRAMAIVALLLAVLPLSVATASADTNAPVMSETFEIGPFDLSPRGQVGDQVNRLFEQAPRPSGDLAIRSITFDFIDGDGNPIPHDVAHLHHLVLLDSARPDHLCSYPSSSRFAATGTELTDFALPEGYAYLAPDAPWSSVYHVMNLSDAPVTASIQYTVSWTDPEASDVRDVEPYFFDVTGCWGNSEYHVPGDGGPDSVHEQSRTYAIDRDGTIVVGGGHLHAGGIDLTLYRNDDELCRAEAVYHHGGPDGHHSLAGVTPCGMLDEPLSAGDEVRLVSRYHNHEPVPGAMGIMVTYIHHTGPPPPPPTLEIQDLRLEDGALTGQVLCNRPLQVHLEGSVSQDKGGPAVDLHGYSVEPVDCDSDGAPFVVQLVYGNGVLTGGKATYSIAGWGWNGRDQAYDDDTGELRVNGRIEPAGYDVPVGGPIPISLDRSSSTPRTVTGTVTCETPTQLDISVQGTQRVGRHLIDAYGWSMVPCSGETAFSVEVTSSSGRLAGGPLDVVIHAYDLQTYEPSVAAGTVILNGSAPPSPGATLPPTDPESPVQVTGATSGPDGLTVTVTHTGCPAGSDYYISLGARDGRGGRGGRVVDEDDFLYAFVDGTCDGDPLTIAMEMPTTDRPPRSLEVWVNFASWNPVTDEYSSAFNTAEVTVSRH